MSGSLMPKWIVVIISVGYGLWKHKKLIAFLTLLTYLLHKYLLG